MQVRIHVLGGFRVRVDGQEVPGAAWSRKDAASLVRLLAISEGHRRHREQVIDLLWPDVDLTDAAPRLHKAAYYARRSLGSPDAVVLRGEMVALFPEHEVQVDLASFEAAAATALAAGSARAAADVLDTYPGEPLPDDLYAEWAADARERVLARRLQLLRQAHRWEDLLQLDPLDEEAHLAAMRSVAEAGDLRGALRLFERLERVLRRELDTAPSDAAVGLRDELAAELRAQGGLSPAEERRIEQAIRFCRTSDGVTIAYACSGHGPPLLKAANWLTHLDHDWNSPVWRHWLLDLSRHHQLVRYDERGCGLSDWDVGEPTFDDWVSDLESVADAAGLERFPLLGISQGAAVAVVYAARHPERVTRLVLYGGYAQGRLARSDDPQDHEIHRLQVELARLGWGTDNPAFRQVFTSQFIPGGSRELWDSFNELQRQTTSPENAARVVDLTGPVDVREDARKVRAPALVLHARGDQRPPFEQGRLLASCIPDSRFVALESDNHILLGDEPAWPAFLAEVESFLAEG